MPLPTLVFLALGIGVAAALAGGTELRLSPRHALLTNSFMAFAMFLGLVLLPASAYFYIFHGDWFLLYTIDVNRIPSAMALVGFILEAGVGMAGFSLGAGLARSQRSRAGIVAVAVCLLLCGSVVLVWPERLSMVGTLAQYRGGFGLTDYGGSLLQGAMAMAGFIVVGGVFLVLRIRLGGRSA